MDTTAKITERRRSKRKAAASVIRVQLKDGLGNARWITADLLDASATGVKLALVAPLPLGVTLPIRGRLREDQQAEDLQANVRWCIERANGSFHVGLEFLDVRPPSSSDLPPPPVPEEPHPDELDCYEIMQLSPNADAETIARVYRMLALRYHPDNAETGNEEMFVRLSEAHRILADPERRARYDVQHREAHRLRWKIFDQPSAATGAKAERRKRQGILSLLHAKMLVNPEQAELNIQMLEELLGCPREHLQAALWYLKGKGFIRRTDNGRYAITVEGCDEIEAETTAPVGVSRRLTEGE